MLLTGIIRNSCSHTGTQFSRKRFCDRSAHQSYKSNTRSLFNGAESVTIGGPASFIFAQVVTGGDWSTEIAVGNTSAGLQTIRIDFFADNGVNTGSLTDIVIPSRGVFTFNTAQVSRYIHCTASNGFCMP